METPSAREVASTPAPAGPRRRLFGWAGAAAGAAVVATAVGWFAVLPAVELNAAESALRKNDAAQARTHLDRYLARKPDDKHALFLAARAARLCGAYADAEKYLAASDDGGGQTDERRTEWLLLGVQQGDFLGAEGIVKAAGRGTPETVPILSAIAKGYDANFRYPEALEVLDQLLKLDPTHVPALVHRSLLAARLRRVEKAEEDARQAVALAPRDADAHFVLASVCHRRGLTREAVQHFEFASKLRAGDPEIPLGLSRALAYEGQGPAARDVADRLTASHPSFVEGWIEAGRQALRSRGAADALDKFDRAAALAPWHREVQTLRLAALTDLAKTDEAERCRKVIADHFAADGVGGSLKMRASDNPGDAAVRLELWDWSLKNGAEAEGLAWLSEILRYKPDHPQANAALADYFDRHGQPRRAAAHRNPTRRP